MTEDQYILAVRGTLDRQSATVLSREIESLLGRGYRRIVLSGDRLGPVLPEGVVELQRWALRYAEAQGDDAAPLPGVVVHSLEGPASAQFLLQGVPVTERRAQILPPVAATDIPVHPDSDPAPTANSSAKPRRVLHETQLELSGNSLPAPDVFSDTSGWLAHFPPCHLLSRVRQPGDYACPVCGAPFRMAASGALQAHAPG